MVLGKNKGAELAFKCDESQIPISKTMELLGVTVDDKLNFENHIAKICRKVMQSTNCCTKKDAETETVALRD